MAHFNSNQTAMSGIVIVLVEPSLPANIGSCARAMLTMGLSCLRLVSPKAFPHEDAYTLAAGADAVLDQAALFASLQAAVADCHLVLGTTARPRHLGAPALSPRAAAQQASSIGLQGKCALVFGRERTGLTNEESEACAGLIQIDTNPDFSSLNLAAAVQVITYELRQAVLQQEVQPAAYLPASANELELLFDHYERVLIELKFLNPQNPRYLMRRLRNLYARARPDENEVNILRGILTATERRS